MNPPNNEQKWPKSPDQPKGAAPADPNTTLLLHCPDCNHPLRISRKHFGVAGNCLSCGIKILARETTPGKAEIVRASETPGLTPSLAASSASESPSSEPKGFLSIKPAVKNKSLESSSSPLPGANGSSVSSTVPQQETPQNFDSIHSENSLVEGATPVSNWMPPKSKTPDDSKKAHPAKEAESSLWSFAEAVQSTQSSEKPEPDQNDSTEPSECADLEPSKKSPELPVVSSFFANDPSPKTKPEETQSGPFASERQQADPPVGPLVPTAETKTSSDAQSSLSDVGSVLLSPQKDVQPTPPSLPAESPKSVEFATIPEKTPVTSSTPVVSPFEDIPQEPKSAMPPPIPVETPRPVHSAPTAEEAPATASSLTAAASPFAAPPEEITSPSPSELPPEEPKSVGFATVSKETPVETTPTAYASPFAAPPEESKSPFSAELPSRKPKSPEAAPAVVAMSPFDDLPESADSAMAPSLPAVENTVPPTGLPSGETQSPEAAPAVVAMSPFDDLPESADPAMAPSLPTVENTAPPTGLPSGEAQSPEAAPAVVAMSPFDDLPESADSAMAPSLPAVENTAPPTGLPSGETQSPEAAPAVVAMSPFDDLPESADSAMAPSLPAVENTAPPTGLPSGETQSPEAAPAVVAMSPFDDLPESADSAMAPSLPAVENTVPTTDLPKVAESPQSITPVSPFETPAEEVTKTGQANSPFDVEDTADQNTEVSLFGPPPATDEGAATSDLELPESDSPVSENSSASENPTVASPDGTVLNGPILLKQEKTQKASLSPTATFAIALGALVVFGIGVTLVTSADHKEQIKLQVAEWLEPGTVLIEKLPFGLGNKLLHPEVSGQPMGIKSSSAVSPVINGDTVTTNVVPDSP